MHPPETAKRKQSIFNFVRMRCTLSKALCNNRQLDHKYFAIRKGNWPQLISSLTFIRKQRSPLQKPAHIKQASSYLFLPICKEQTRGGIMDSPSSSVGLGVYSDISIESPPDQSYPPHVHRDSETILMPLMPSSWGRGGGVGPMMVIY